MRFPFKINVMSAPKYLHEADYEDPIFRYEAIGVSNRSTRPKVLENDNVATFLVDETYADDQNIAHELRIIAADYAAVTEVFQKRWEATLARATSLKDAISIK